MILTFLAPSSNFPTGGGNAIYEFANGMCRRGHEVHLVHLDILGNRIERLEELTWCEIDPRVQQHLPPETDAPDMPEADFLFCFDHRIPEGHGRRLMFIQAYRILPPDLEQLIYGVPFPRICTSSFLRRTALEVGGPEHPAWHVPYGLRHDIYRLTRPIEPREERIAMLYNPHPLKGADVGLAALERVRRSRPDLAVDLFGTSVPERPLPAWARFTLSPGHDALVDGIYNRARVFISSAHMEGFGLAPIEAMAGGCALATTDNGGSEDYAVEGATAVVSPPGDIDALAANLKRLLDDDAERARIAEAGVDHVRRFDWDRSADLLERHLLELA